MRSKAKQLLSPKPEICVVEIPIDKSYLFNGSFVGWILQQDLLVLGRPAGQVSIVLLVLVLKGLLPLHPNQLLRRFFNVPFLKTKVKKHFVENDKSYLDDFAFFSFSSSFAPNQVNRPNLVDFVFCLKDNHYHL